MPGVGSKALKRSGSPVCKGEDWDSSSDDAQYKEKKRRTVARVSNVNEKNTSLHKKKRIVYYDKKYTNGLDDDHGYAKVQGTNEGRTKVT